MWSKSSGLGPQATAPVLPGRGNRPPRLQGVRPPARVRACAPTPTHRGPARTEAHALAAGQWRGVSTGPRKGPPQRGASDWPRAHLVKADHCEAHGDPRQRSELHRRCCRASGELASDKRAPTQGRRAESDDYVPFFSARCLGDGPTDCNASPGCGAERPATRRPKQVRARLSKENAAPMMRESPSRVIILSDASFRMRWPSWPCVIRRSFAHGG